MLMAFLNLAGNTSKKETNSDIDCLYFSKWIESTYFVAKLAYIWSLTFLVLIFVNVCYTSSIYTMHNKFSNCFVWVSLSTSDCMGQSIHIGS